MEVLYNCIIPLYSLRAGQGVFVLLPPLLSADRRQFHDMFEVWFLWGHGRLDYDNFHDYTSCLVDHYTHT